ncbi:MAG: type I DNA topoisomerase, partial [Chloroflexota bacterium]
DIEADFRPTYTTLKGKTNLVKRLVKAIRGADAVYLGTDPDREGEAISYHVAELIRKANPGAALQRVSFDAITPSAVKAAFAKPRTVDADLVAAQEARRLLDRLVGFPGSRYLWGQVKGKGLSAGRVQSVALRLVVERDREIENFIPREYWTITGRFRVAEGAFDALLKKWQGKKPDLPNRDAAEAVIAALNGVGFTITKAQPKQRKRKAPPPFTTSTMQQAASSHLKLSPDQTMRYAQTLYENGYITYMRTDSPTVSPEGAALAKRKILELYGEKYHSSNRYGAKGKAEEAHECIRPTDVDVYSDAVRETLPEKSKRAADLYRLIFRRFIASQMPPAIYDELHVDVTGGPAVFGAKGSRLAFDGFLKVYNMDEERDKNTDEQKAVSLPPLTVGENAVPEKFTPEQHYTQPPYRYSEATLIKALERNGVGRPSTFASMVGTLKRRKYAKLQKRKLVSTDLGREVY